MLIQSSAAFSSQTFYSLQEGTQVAYCAGIRKTTKPANNLFGRNMPKAMLVLLPGQQLDTVGLASSHDEGIIRSYKELVIMNIDKALCAQKLSIEATVVNR